ncbi:hypothetical protein SAMN02745181_0701 [Rubritalea squalenifaciens DSM 18772]|uniref:Succinylglutamate desuccinylase/Aspartoacylase catalytic domain-containing protein n=1 Tax=Rubritalea squalenifaciens DSM 18772 TaxID=1123071 RepID=A0A1M6DCC4_9BACT|nr:succinylglutamate desuccinylase/aspartoacylase family protein [Rubritalea squalenifaciens]SHI70914.1 hypothetical protein SAMN02745181_0701 [Rubritalea squalenifaciens DSM 18772]
MSSDSEIRYRHGAITIAGTTINPGEQATVAIPYGTYSSYETVHLKAHVRVSKKPGPTLLVTAGIHGDEVNGTEIVRRLMKEKFIKRMSGTLITIPVINAPAYSNRSRYMPDRRDLNRLFPGAPSGSLGARLAHTLCEYILPHVDLVIDLHTGTVNRANLPQLRVSPGDKEANRLAKIFSPPVLLIASIREGSFRHACSKRGIPVLLYESGEALRLDTPSIRFALRGIRSVMRELGMISKSSTKRFKLQPVVCKKSLWERAPMGGIFTPLVQLGRAVNQGDTLGFMADPFGDTEIPIIASYDGILIGRTNEGVADEGDALVHIGFASQQETAEDRIHESAGNFPDLPDEEDDHPVHTDPFADQL